MPRTALIAPAALAAIKNKNPHMISQACTVVTEASMLGIDTYIGGSCDVKVYLTSIFFIILKLQERLWVHSHGLFYFSINTYTELFFSGVV